MNVIIRHFHNFPKRNKHHSNINRRLFMNWTGLFCVCVCVVCEEITTVLKIHLVHLPIEVAFCYVAFGWKCCICVSVSALRTRMAILKFQIGKQRSIEIRNCYHSIWNVLFFFEERKKKDFDNCVQLVYSEDHVIFSQLPLQSPLFDWI